MRLLATICVLLKLILASELFAVETNYVVAHLAEKTSDFAIKTWRMADGLPSDRVRGILQTRDGYIWVATFNGLARFDGVRFQSFRDADTPALRNSLINALFEDSEDRLWIGNDTGEISWRDSKGFHPVSTPTNWPTGPIESIVESPRGTILALNREGVIGVFTNGQCVKVIGSVSGTRYSELVTDRDGTVWAVRRGGLIVSLRDEAEVLDPTTPRPGAGFRNIARARHGGLWIRTGNQVRRWLHGEWVEDRGIQPWKATLSVTMFETSNGQLLVGTFTEGLYVIDEDGKTTQINRESGLQNNWATSLIEDREHNIWVGTISGLTQLRAPVLTMLNPADRWDNRAIESVWQDKEGGLWIGTEGAGLYQYKRDTFRRYFDTVGGSGQRIRAVLEDRDGRVWIGSQAGLRILDGEKIVPVAADVEIPALVYALHETRDGTLWIGTQNGVAWHRNGKWERRAANLYRADVRSIVESPNGDVWLGMRGGGVARYADGKFTQFLQKDGLPYEYVWSLFADADGSVWIGTSGGGLARWRDGKFVNFTTKHGLPSDFICGIQGDDEGNLWIASYGGIFRVAKKELDQCASGEIKAINPFVLGASDGLASLEMSGGNHPSGQRLKDGRFCFPTSDGLAMVDPAEIKLSRLPPTVRIEEVLVDRQNVTFELADSSTGVVAAPAARLTVPPGKAQLEFRYTALSHVSPERVRFKIMMVNVDRDWVEVGERRSAFYTHVKPGDYEFRVIACNNHGVWNEDGATMRITVQPFFWQTWWFAPLCWLGGGALFVGTIITMLRRRHYRKLETVERARTVERERRRIAQDLHDDLGAGLTEIDSTSAIGHETAGTNEESREYFREIGTRSRELITSMDEIVWAVNPKNDNLASVTSYFCHYAEQFLRTTAMSCRFDVPENVPPLPLNAEQRHSLFLAYKEALNNAVRHSGGTEVRTEFAVTDRELKITVADNGRGMATNGSPGSDGLANMRTRLEQLGGRCEFHCPEDGGAVVVFALPLDPRKRL